MKVEPIIVEQTYDSTVEQVWSAITDEAKMRQWFFETMDSFKPEVGFQTEFNVQAHDKQYLRGARYPPRLCHLWDSRREHGVLQFADGHCRALANGPCTVDRLDILVILFSLYGGDFFPFNETKKKISQQTSISKSPRLSSGWNCGTEEKSV